MAALNPRALPNGREGRILAVGLLVLAVAILWFGLVSPLFGWYVGRDQALTQRIALERRMAALAASLPATERAAAATSQQAPQAQLILSGASDPIANAALENLIDGMARQTSATLVSTEALPGVQTGTFRRVGLHVTVRAPWSNLLRLLAAVEQAEPRMTVGDLQVQAGPLTGQEQTLDMSFSVMAFRAGTGGAPAPMTDSDSDNGNDSQ